MIKILFFVDTTLASGGAEKVLRTLVNNMDQTKFHITVQTAWPEDSEKYLSHGIQYRSLFSKKNKITRFLYRLETMLGLTYPLRMKDNYDIEIAYLENGPTKVLSRSTNRHAVKLAWVHCDLCQMSSNIARFRKKVSKWYDRYDKVICVSEDVRESFASIFGDKHNTLVLHNAVDSDDIINKAKAPLPEDITKKRTVIVTVGRMYHPKGYDRLLRAHKRLQNEGYEYDLWILGDGPDIDMMKTFITENKLEDSVLLPGFQTNPYSFMNAGDIFVCSSRYEGFSTVVTEALILGKPVVTTKCSGMHELLGESEYGLITENSEQGIYQGLKTLLDDSDLLEKYQKLAKQRGKTFSKETLVKQTEDFFINTLGVTQTQ